MIRLRLSDATTKKINGIVKFLMYAMYMFNKDEPQWLLVIVGLNIVKNPSDEVGSQSGPAA